MLETFLKELVEYYYNDHIAPGLQMAWIIRTAEWYVAVHQFPSGVASRRVVAKACEPNLETAIEHCRTIWQRIITEERAAKAGAN